MRFKGKHTVSKQDLKEDKFQQTIEKIAAAYYRDRQKFWIGGAVALAAIVGVILLLQGKGKGVNPAAEIAFTQAVGTYSMGNMEQSEQLFKELTGRFGGEFVGAKGRFYLGNIYFNTQRYAEAKTEFSRFLSRVKKDPYLSPSAQMGIGNAEEQLGNNPAAAKAYEAVQKRWPKSPLVYESLMAAGRCYRNAGEYAKAAAAYEKLLKEKPAGEKGEEVKVQLAYVKTLQANPN